MGKFIRYKEKDEIITLERKGAAGDDYDFTSFSAFFVLSLSLSLSFISSLGHFIFLYRTLRSIDATSRVNALCAALSFTYSNTGATRWLSIIFRSLALLSCAPRRCSSTLVVSSTSRCSSPARARISSCRRKPAARRRCNCCVWSFNTCGKGGKKNHE